MTNLLTFIFGAISRSLAAKLIIALVSLIIIGGGISWYTLIHMGRENLINEAVKDAASYFIQGHRVMPLAHLSAALADFTQSSFISANRRSAGSNVRSTPPA